MTEAHDHGYRIAIVGTGQIARMQHIPAIAVTEGIRLVALVNPLAVALETHVPLYPSLTALLRSAEIFDAIAICTPPQIRFGLAIEALDAGKHVLLEKPPAATTTEIAALERHAQLRGLTLFTAWHSLFSAAVAPAREILAERGIRAMQTIWKEDVAKYHPGVDWFFQPGGMGIFDAGINALSILIETMPEPLFVRAASFDIARGGHTPIAASLQLATPNLHQDLTADFLWNAQQEERWSIGWTLADGGRLMLERGGAQLTLDGETLVDEADQEYPRLYAHFRDLIRSGRSAIEIRPLQLVADAFMLARRN